MSAPRKPLVIACIPAFNEESTIGAVVRGALKHVDMVIVCDDGSTDLTVRRALEAGAYVVRHTRNMGYGAALRTLFKVARRVDPDAMVILDADGQHDPNDIPVIIRPVLSGEADIVVGSRMAGEGVPVQRWVGVRVITLIVRVSAYPGLRDAQSGFRAYSRRAIRAITITEPGMGASTEILLKAACEGLKLKEIPIRVRYKGITHRISPWLHGLSVLFVTLKHVVRRYFVFVWNVFKALIKGLVKRLRPST